MSGLGDQASKELCRAAHTATGGNPFLLDALVKAVRAHGRATPDEVTVLSLGPQPVADAVTRRMGQLGAGAIALAGSPNLRQVRELWLYANDIGEEGGWALARSPWLENLRGQLDLTRNPLGPEVCAALQERFHGCAVLRLPGMGEG